MCAPPLPIMNSIFFPCRAIAEISPGWSVIGNALEMWPLNVSSARSAAEFAGISRCTLPECE